jgi:acetylornithine deacetylase/succinyl-diaminopimelate desuccinylase-like protein
VKWIVQPATTGSSFFGDGELICSAETSMRVPTAMIFVPSKDGISHNPNEYTSKEEWYVLKGNVLANLQRRWSASATQCRS